MPGVKTVSIKCWVFVGSVYENSVNNGISHFVEHMIFRGNHSLGTGNDLFRRFEALGGEVNASTSFDTTEYWLDFHLDHMEEGIDGFCKFLQEPLFEKIEIERSVILEEVLLDYNDEGDLIDPEGLVDRCFWPDHSLGFPIIGTIDSLSKITVEDLKNWFNTYYRPGNMLIGVTGDFEAKQVIDQIAKAFDSRLSSPREDYQSIKPNPLPVSQIQWGKFKDNQFTVHWSFPLNGLSFERRLQTQLIHRIIDDGSNSRLHRLIREEKGLVYDIEASYHCYKDGILISLQAVVSLKNFEAFLSELVNVVRDLAQKGVTQTELDLAKHRYRCMLDCISDTPQGILQEMVASEIYPAMKPTKEILEKLEMTTLAEVNQIATSVFQQQLTCFAIVGPKSEDADKILRKYITPWLLPR